MIVPQGWTGEYDGWDPLTRGGERRRSRGRPIGSGSSRSGCSTTSIPSPSHRRDHLRVVHLARRARRADEPVRLGHIVICTAFRNPALTAKMISTMDVISGGRMELGIGAGWKRDEWLAYGYGFPETRERLAMLGDDLEVITAMLAGDKHQHATFEGEHAGPGRHQRPEADPAAAVPIMVGGNGPNVTWRLAARYADELNVDGMSPDEVARGAAGDPHALRGDRPRSGHPRVSVHIWSDTCTIAGQQRVDLLAGYRELGVDRVMGIDDASATPTRRSSPSPRTPGPRVWRSHY